MFNLPSFGRDTVYLINIYSIDLAEVIAILYNHAQPVNMGWLQFQEGKMSQQKAQEEAEITLEDARNNKITKIGYIDYLEGRFMKLRFYLTEDKIGWVDPSIYDGAYGVGKALELLRPLLEKTLLILNFPK